VDGIDGILDKEKITAFQANGKTALLQTLVDIFSRHYPLQLLAIRQAIRQGDACQLQETAHNLKGSIVNFSTKAAYQQALSLEQRGKAGELAQADEEFEQLAVEIDRLADALNRMLTKGER
jgi:HPt (histidine-containing phosphotransfer) domain-containing protein